MAAALNVGDWVLFEGKGDSEPIWLESCLIMTLVDWVSIPIKQGTH